MRFIRFKECDGFEITLWNALSQRLVFRCGNSLGRVMCPKWWQATKRKPARYCQRERSLRRGACNATCWRPEWPDGGRECLQRETMGFHAVDSAPCRNQAGRNVKLRDLRHTSSSRLVYIRLLAVLLGQLMWLLNLNRTNCRGYRLYTHEHATLFSFTV